MSGVLSSSPSPCACPCPSSLLTKKLKLEAPVSGRSEASMSDLDSSAEDDPCRRKRRRKAALREERLSRLSSLIRSYLEHTREIQRLQGNQDDFRDFLRSRCPPSSVLRDSLSSLPSRPPPRVPVYSPHALEPLPSVELGPARVAFSLPPEARPPRCFSRPLSLCRTETWVLKRVQELVREGLWSARRLPKVAERPRPRVHWDGLLSEMAWMATDFHQERRWKIAAAKMLAYSAKEYVEQAQGKRARRMEEEERRRRRRASFMAGEVRAFWKRISGLSLLKLNRHERALEQQMLEQQLSYVNHERTLISEPEEEEEDAGTRSTEEEEIAHIQNGLSTSREDTEEHPLASAATSELDDDESTICEQELHEKRLEEEAKRRWGSPQNKELRHLHSDSEMPLFQLLRKAYPGVLSEYLDLYDQLLQEEESSSDSSASSSSEEEDEEVTDLELMTPPESGNSLESSLDSLLLLPGCNKPPNNLKIRDIQTLAEEADRFKPLKSSLRRPEVLPQRKVLPLLRGGDLRDYQRVGVDWLISMHKERINSAIGDEPGLGRKVMIVAFLSWLAMNDVCRKPHLLIVPLSSLASWSNTLQRWCPSLAVRKYDGSKVTRCFLFKGRPSQHQVILTSYRVFFRDSHFFLKHSWNYLILHDAQNLGRVSQMTSILDLKSRVRLSLLGGGLPSNPIDLWNILYLLQPKTYSLHSDIESRTFVEGTEDYAENVKKLITFISPFLLRRTRSQVEKQLPLPQERVYMLEMMPRQRKLYDDFLAEEEGSRLTSGDPLSISDVLRELRLICDHPFLHSDGGVSLPLVLPRVELCIPKLFSSALHYDPFKDIDLNSMNFVFFTHETTLTVIISDRIRKSRAPKSLIEDLPNKSDPLPPSVPSGKLTLEFQTSSSSSASSSNSSSSSSLYSCSPYSSFNCSNSNMGGSSHSSRNAPPHIYLSASVIKSLKSSSLGASKTPLPPSRPPASPSGLGALHKESLRVIATFNERRCLGLPLYGKDLVDILTIVTSIRPVKSMFRGMGLVNTLAAFSGAEVKDKNIFRYNTRGLKSLVNASRDAFKQIHSESTILSKIKCYNAPVRLKARPSSSSLSVPPISDSMHEIRTRFLHSDNLPWVRGGNNLFWRLPSSSAKLNKLNNILREALCLKERVALFCETKEMRDLIQAFLRHKFYSYVLLDPDDSYENKSESLLSYSLSGESLILLTSTRTSALGLDVSSIRARHIILYDSSWDHEGFKSNPWIQRLARTPGVIIHRLLCKDSVEENISRKSVQRKISADLHNNDALEPEISRSTIEELFSINLCGALKKNERNYPRGDNQRGSTLEPLLAATPSNESEDILIKSMVLDLAELDPGCADSCFVTSQLDISSHQLFDNLSPIERFGMGRSPLAKEEEDSGFLLTARSDWERVQSQKLREFEEEVKRLECMSLLTFSVEDAKRSWYGSTGQPMPLWPAPSPSAPTIDTGLQDQEFHLSFWYSTDRLMEDSELPPVYAKKESLKRSLLEAGITGELPEIKPKLKKEESSAHAPRSLFDRPSPALLKARKDIRVGKFRLNSSSSAHTPSVVHTSSSSPVNSAVAGIRNPLPRTQVEAENSPEWLIQEDWALHQAVEDLLELPLNLTVIHPGHTPNWDMVSDMVNSVSRIYRGPRQCKNRYESIVVPREEGRILYDIIPPPPPPASLPASPSSSSNLPALLNGGLLHNSKKSKKSNSSSNNSKNLLKIVPSSASGLVSKSNRPMKTSQLYLQDNNSKWSGLYRSRFENIKSVANKRSPTAKPILVNPTQKNPKHAAVLAESGISYEAPLNPILVAQNRAERLQKEKQKSQQELSQQRIASAQAAAAAAQQSAAASAAANRVVANSSSAAANPVVVGLSGSSQQQRAQLTEMVRNSSTGAVVVSSSPSTVVTLAGFNRLQAAQKVIAGAAGTSAGRPLTPHQVNLLRQQAIISKAEPNQKLRLPVSSASSSVAKGVTVVSQAPQGANNKAPQIRQIASPGGSKATTTTNVRALTEQDMKILVAKQQQQQQAAGKVQLPGNTVTAAQLFAQAGIKVQEGTGSSSSGQPVATLVKTVSAIGQGGQSVTIPVQSVPHVKAALARGQQMQMKLLQQQLLQRKASGQRVAIGTPGGSKAGATGLPTQLIVQKNVVPHHQAVTVQQILKGAGPHTVLTKPGAPGTPIQARVIPSSAPGRTPQTIQVVSGRGSGGQFKVAASANSQQILNQVSAALGQPVSMAVRTSDGVPVSVALRSNPQPKAIITSSPSASSSANLSSPALPSPAGSSKDSK